MGRSDSSSNTSLFIDIPSGIMWERINDTEYYSYLGGERSGPYETFEQMQSVFSIYHKLRDRDSVRFPPRS